MARDLRQMMSRVCEDLIEVVDRLDNRSHQNRPPSNSGSAPSTDSPLDRSSAGRTEGALDHAVGGGGGGPGPHERSRSTRPSTSRAELGRLFNFKPSSSSQCSRKGKLKMWKHTFVCLAQPEQDQTPDHMEKARLKMAGLGQKSCSIPLSSDADELNDSLIKYFPKLYDGGGFELLQQRCNNTRQLDVVPVPQCGYNVEFLQSVVANAKLYIRPMQKELDLSYVGGSEREMACLKCKRLCPVQSLKQHVMECRGEAQECKSDDDDESDLPSYSEFLYGSDSSSKDIVMVDLDSPDSKDYDDEDDLLVIIKESESQGNSNKPNSVKDVVDLLKVQLTPEYFTIVVRRSHFLKDALQKCRRDFFNPSKLIQVEFVGEEGLDTGGLTREFFSLLQQTVVPTYINMKGSFVHNSVALREGVYFILGQLAGMSLTQGGAGFNVFSSAVFSYICGVKLEDISAEVDQLSNPQVAQIVREVELCDSTEQLRKICSQYFDVMCDSGFTKPFTSVLFEDRSVIIESLCLHEVILSSKAEADQFCDGLDSSKVLTHLTKHSSILEKFFVQHPIESLTSDTFRGLFKFVRYSIEGSNQRQNEETTYIHFVTYLEDVEKGSGASNVSLSNILSFFTGATSVPPGGFRTSPVLSFSSTNEFPTASTCALELTLPTVYHTDYPSFKDHMDKALLSHGGFGLF